MARVVVLQLIAGIIGGVIAARKGRGAFIWGLLCFIFPLLTVVIVLLPPLERPEVKRCPQCSRPIGRHELACSSCRGEKTIELVQCGTCGNYIPEDKACPVCDLQK